MRILVVEDDPLLQEGISLIFPDNAITSVVTGEEAITKLSQVPYNILFLDIKLKGQLTGIDVLRRAREIDPLLPAIMMSGLDDRPTITQCLGLGAVDYVVKGHVNLSAYKYLVHKASVWRSQQVLTALNKKSAELTIDDSFTLIKGSSPRTLELKQKISILGRTDGPFLIIGETGTGKELIAKSLWQAKGGKARPFVTVNCAEFQGTTIEGELFGYEKGAFTGANNQRIGLFEAAHGGDIFLDEIGELPLEFQAKLLRVIQEKKIRRMGSNIERLFEFRVIAATNRDLHSESAAGHFRTDLLYRLDVHSLYATPLREKPNDVFDLVEFYFAEAGFASLRIDNDVKNKLINFQWPGNVRQLTAFVKFVAPYLDKVDPHLTSELWGLWEGKCPSKKGINGNRPLSKDYLTDLIHSGCFKYDHYSEETRNSFINLALEMSANNRTEAARILGISRQRLVNWLSEIG